jgi:hypothetical protein
MHLEGPWLSTTGKRKGKKKFRNSEEAQRTRQLDDDWKELQKKWGFEAEQKKRARALSSKTYVPPKVSRRDEGQPKLPSLDTGHKGAVTIKQPMQYTGDKIVGIGTMHKSNAVPIFSDQEAKDISSMRR